MLYRASPCVMFHCGRVSAGVTPIGLTTADTLPSPGARCPTRDLNETRRARARRADRDTKPTQSAVPIQIPTQIVVHSRPHSPLALSVAPGPPATRAHPSSPESPIEALINLSLSSEHRVPAHTSLHALHRKHLRPLSCASVSMAVMRPPAALGVVCLRC